MTGCWIFLLESDSQASFLKGKDVWHEMCENVRTSRASNLITPLCPLSDFVYLTT